MECVSIPRLAVAELYLGELPRLRRERALDVTCRGRVVSVRLGAGAWLRGTAVNRRRLLVVGALRTRRSAGVLT